MNLYLVSQYSNNNWDTYDSMLVAAEDEEAARIMHPEMEEDASMEIGYVWWNDDMTYDSWALPEKVIIKLIGVTIEAHNSRVIITSFNAG